MRTIHLCNGIGGSLWAGSILGWQSIYALDHDPWRCDRVAAQAAAGWWPHLAVECADLAEWDPAQAGVDGVVDCLAAGFSCRDISAAGLGRGITGPSTGPTYSGCMRAIEYFRPAWVLFENSPNIRTRGRHVVTGDLVALGYGWRDGVIAAADVGAPHIRARWYCLAHRADLAGERWPQGRAEWAVRGRQSEVAHVATPPADALRHRPQESVQCGGLRAADAEAIKAAARYCGTYDWNPADPGILPVVDGLANRSAVIAGLGDAWVPLQAATAWRLLGGP